MRRLLVRRERTCGPCRLGGVRHHLAELGARREGGSQRRSQLYNITYWSLEDHHLVTSASAFLTISRDGMI